MNITRKTGIQSLLSVLFALAVLCLLTSPGLAEESEKGVHMIPFSFSDVAAKASPAVVNISTEKLVGGPQAGGRQRGPGRGWPNRPPDMPGGQNDPFNDFFERFFGDQAPHGNRREHSLGSGFIIDPKGLVITNNHVVEGADDITVKMSDGREYSAKILGRDPKTDLALLEIDAKETFHYLKLGDSSQLKIGDWVVAIGNPFGLEHTVTAGILSARGRAIGAGPYDDFLQTDASINPGNSGGPLLNLKGEVVGINTAIVAGGQGIGFAIPTSLAKNIVAQLRDKGRVVRGWLGVMIQKITPELADAFRLEGQKGALVADVTPDGPADEAGLKRGDVIVRFNGTEINEYSDLPAIVANVPPDTKVKVTVVRNGKEMDFNVVLGELPDEHAGIAPAARAADLGLNVKQLTPELAARMGLPDIKGVIIVGISDDSAASDSGLKPGDLILEMNRQPVQSVEDYERLADKVKKGDTVLFLIRRGSNTLFFTLDVK